MFSTRPVFSNSVVVLLTLFVLPSVQALVGVSVHVLVDRCKYMYKIKK